MFKGINKFAAMMTVASAALMQGCGPSEAETAAAQLLGSAEQLYEMKDYQGAIDSVKALNERYHGMTDLRRGGLRIQAMATEGLIKDSIEAIEPEMVRAQLEKDSLAKGFIFVEPKAEGLDGYYLSAKLVASSAMELTTVQPRVDKDGFFYLTANVNGRSIGLNGLRIESKDGAVWQSAPLSAARTASVEGSDIGSFAPENLDGLGPWMKQHGTSGLKGVLTGSRGTAAFTIGPELRAAIETSADYSAAWQESRLLSIRREKLERKLQVVRDQLANMPLPSQD